MKRMLPFLTGLALAVVSAAPASAADDKDKQLLSAAVQKLRACAGELNAGDFPKQAKSLEEIADKITAWTAGHATIRREDLQALQVEKDRLDKQVRMWASAGDKARADVLTKQVEALDGICKSLKTVVTDEGPAPTPAPAPGGLAPAAPGSPTMPELTSLTVSLSMAAAPTPTPMPRPTPAPRPTLQPRRPGMMDSEGPMPGPGYPMATPRPMQVEAPKVLTVNLRELSQTFTDIRLLEQYLRDNVAKLASTPVTFEIARDVAWENVHQVLGIFASAPLTGEMRLADLKLRSAPTAASASPLPSPFPAAGVLGAPTPAPGPEMTAIPLPPLSVAPGGPVGTPLSSPGAALPLGLTPLGPSDGPTPEPVAPVAPTAPPVAPTAPPTPRTLAP